MPKNVIFILSDEHRWDAWGALNKDIQTPNLDRIAASGVSFDNCFCVAQACVPSRASIMTGRYAETHGLWSNDVKLPVNERTWAGHLSDNGYQTVAVGRTHHIDAGFDSVIRVPSGNSYPINCHNMQLQCFWSDEAYVGPSEATFDEYYETRITKTAIDFMHEMHRGGEPFALYVGYLAPHSALTPPEPYWSLYEDIDVQIPNDTPPPEDILNWAREWGTSNITPERYRRIVRGYYGMISAMDACIGMLLDEVASLGIAEDTLIIYTSDHGEMLGNKGLFIKGFGYDPSIRVPLIATCPGTIPAGIASNSMIELIDLSETMMDALGVQRMKTSGISAWKSFTQETQDHRDWIYSALSNGQVCRNNRYKWIHRIVGNKACDEIYDLEIDPSENNNIADTLCGDKVRQEFLLKLQDIYVTRFRRSITDLHPTAVQPRLLPFFTT